MDDSDVSADTADCSRAPAVSDAQSALSSESLLRQSWRDVAPAENLDSQLSPPSPPAEPDTDDATVDSAPASGSSSRLSLPDHGRQPPDPYSALADSSLPPLSVPPVSIPPLIVPASNLETEAATPAATGVGVAPANSTPPPPPAFIQGPRPPGSTPQPLQSQQQPPPPPSTPQTSSSIGSYGAPPPPPQGPSSPYQQRYQQPASPRPPAPAAKKKQTYKWVIFGAVLAALFAIGSLAGPSDERQAEQSVTNALAESGVDVDDVTFHPTASEQRCLEREGVTPAEIISAYTAGGSGMDSQDTLLNATLVCTPRILEDAFWIEQMRATFSVGLGTDLSAPEMKCTVQHALDNNRLRPADVLTGIDGDGLLEAVNSCFDEETLAILRGDPGAGPQAYGDDEALDQLFDLCTEGRNQACDILFTLASVGSEYGLLAEDCAGRGLESTLFCTASLFDSNADGYADDNSIGLITGVSQCRTGDMLACDFVFTVSELDSQHIDTATTCGARRVLANDTCLGQYGLTAE